MHNANAQFGVFRSCVVVVVVAIGQFTKSFSYTETLKLIVPFSTKKTSSKS